MPLPDEPAGHDEFEAAAAALDVDPAAAVEEIAAPEGSALVSLRARRDRARQKLHFDLEVPRLDPPVYVRYRPVDQGEVDRVLAQTAKLPEKVRTVMTNAIILSGACLGVFEVVDDHEVSIDPDDRDGKWPTFGRRLGELLGEATGRAAVVARALYLTDGDLISTGQTLMVKSGYAQEQLERESAGN